MRRQTIPQPKSKTHPSSPNPCAFLSPSRHFPPSCESPASRARSPRFSARAFPPSAPVSDDVSGTGRLRFRFSGRSDNGNARASWNGMAAGKVYVESHEEGRKPCRRRRRAPRGRCVLNRGSSSVCLLSLRSAAWTYDLAIRTRSLRTLRCALRAPSFERARNVTRRLASHRLASPRLAPSHRAWQI